MKAKKAKKAKSLRRVCKSKVEQMIEARPEKFPLIKPGQVVPNYVHRLSRLITRQTRMSKLWKPKRVKDKLNAHILKYQRINGVPGK